jgi:general secretion pathway protein I
VRGLRRSFGFTLIEVLVALVIVAFGIGALLTTLTAAADNVSFLRDKSFAEWVALNRVSQLRLALVQAAVGEAGGETQFAGTQWKWTQKITDPGIAGLRRIDVSVARADAKDETTIATAYGFVGLAVAPPSGIDPDWSLDSIANAGPPSPGAKP